MSTGECFYSCKDNPDVVFTEEGVFFPWTFKRSKTKNGTWWTGGGNIDLTLGEDWTNPFNITVSRETVDRCTKKNEMCM